MPITEQQKRRAESIQHAAAHDTSPQVRLIAGPGTGKSHAIVERVRWLLASGVQPDAIFVVSFTRASALELRNRICDYCAESELSQGAQVSVTTLHSLALRVLRMANLLQYPVDPMVLDNWEAKNIFDEEFAKVSGLKRGRCEEIRRDHEAFLSTGHYNPTNHVLPDEPVTQEERDRYLRFHGPRTQTYSCVLPGEIIRKCVENINAGVLDPISLLHIRHLVVDEFQDLNPCDLEFVNHLIRGGVTTFVAGDDDQSIYAFRFAFPQGIQDFTGDYPNAGDYTLSDCFRCTPTIVQTATSIISSHQLPTRIPKTLNSLYASANPPLQGQVHRWKFRSGVAEARAIAASCRDLIEAGMPPREILILISNRRALEHEIAKAFDEIPIPYERPRADDYVDTNEGRFALACLRIACNADDYVAHRTILGLQKGVGIGTCNSIAEQVMQNNLNFKQIFYQQTLPSGVFTGRAPRAISTAQGVFSQISEWEPTVTLANFGSSLEGILEEVLGGEAKQAWINKTAGLPTDITLEETRDYLWADTDAQQEQILNAVYERLGETPPAPRLLSDVNVSDFNRETLDELIDLLNPLVRGDQDRRALFEHAFAGSQLLNHIDYSGAAYTFIVRAVTQLVDYGELERGQTALWALLETVRDSESLGLDKQQRIDALRDTVNHVNGHSDDHQSPSTTDVFLPKVRMMTMHGAKGLSASIVFIPGLEEEIFPGPRRRPYPGLVLEAARLLYVAVSRARIACILSFAGGRMLYGGFMSHAPSRFVNCLGGAFDFREDGNGLTQYDVSAIIQQNSLK